MIPISKDQKLHHTEDGVKYSFHPPIGETEDFIIEWGSGEDRELFNKSKAIYPMAAEQLEKEFKGRRKPKKEEWTKLIEKRTMKIILENVSDEEDDTVERNKKLIDKILFAWESKKNIPAFPKDNKPSKFLPAPLIALLIKWYMGNYSLNVDEVKK